MEKPVASACDRVTFAPVPLIRAVRRVLGPRAGGLVSARARRVSARTDTSVWEQRGLYVLWGDWRVIYVGRATQQGLGNRLQLHRRWRLAGRWDRFSWYGFRKINKNGDPRVDRSAEGPAGGRDRDDRGPADRRHARVSQPKPREHPGGRASAAAPKRGRRPDPDSARRPASEHRRPASVARRARRKHQGAGAPHRREKPALDRRKQLE